MAKKIIKQSVRAAELAGGFPAPLEGNFSKLTDYRNGKNTRHYFGEIIFIALSAMICQCEGFADFVRFAQAKESWLRKYLKLPAGIPSPDTFERVFAGIDPKEFSQCFAEFATSLGVSLGRQLVAIDGKTLRHSFRDGDPSSSLHLISAWACENQITLGQLSVDGKSNEITAIPKLIEQLDLKNQIVSIDAMGCQKKIAQSLHFAEADYLLALKKNQGSLYEGVRSFFNDPASLKWAEQNGYRVEIDRSSEKGHGRYETRDVVICDHLDWIDPEVRKHWLGLKCIVMVISSREILTTGERSEHQRYYLSSLEATASEHQRLIRQHWSIENQCHWVLDVVFDEDQSRVRTGNAASNLAMLRKSALSILKNDKTIKDSIRGKRLRAAFDERVLEAILGLQN